MRTKLIVAGVACVVVAIAIGVWLVTTVGLERADKIASVSSAVIGVFGVVLSVVGIFWSPRGETGQKVRSNKIGGGVKQTNQDGSGQLVENNEITGSVDQKSGVKGDLDIEQ